MNPMFERDMRKVFDGIMGYGTDKLWLSGIAIQPPDGSDPEGDSCSQYPKKNRVEDDTFPEGICRWLQPGNPTFQTISVLGSLGFRVSNIHAYGDKGLLMALEAFQKATAAGVEEADCSPTEEAGVG